jgi:transglutaminase-like putative cysteine protease
MAARRLIYRITGMVATCLALVAAPLDDTQRVAVLTAVAFGIALTVAVPPVERFATRAVGVAVLITALAPPEGLGAVAALVAVAALGAASYDRASMARVVPAAGLPLATLTLRSGVVLDPSLVIAWLVAVLVTVLLGTVAWPVSSGSSLGGSEGYEPVVFDRRRPFQAALVLLLIAPLSLELADEIDAATPSVVATARPGDAQGPQLLAHPGLTGGLDAGQPVDLSDEVVLRVKAERPGYWRGTTYDEWDGRRWSSQAQSTELHWSGPGVRFPQPADRAPSERGELDDFALPGPVDVTQRFTAERAGLDVVLGVWRIDTLYSSVDRAHVGADGSIRLASPLGAGATWTVTSEDVPATADDLRRADPLMVGTGSLEHANYASEDDVSPEAAELARTITADAPTTYDKVRAIESWMDHNLAYTRDIAPLPPGADAVDHLLFESRRGYCEQIGSALVVMLRSLGIPARLVVGYVPGEYDAGSGEWLSRGSDAHAWAEVHFPGVGWRGFDPTAGVPTTVEDAPTAGLGADRSPFGWWSVLASLGAGLVVLLFTPPGARLVSRLRSRCWTRVGAGSRADDLGELHRRFWACGERLGLAWPSTMTLRDRARSLIEAGSDAESVERTVRELERATFDVDQAPDSPTTLNRVRAAVHALEVSVEDVVSRRLEQRRRDGVRSPRRRRRAPAPTPIPSHSRVP